ncbi:hypothetical protein BA195_10160 [Tenacibaculum soleae]|uniref:Uncharacterized protein n=1 Tax=Tenacibaculum soleae TaxID=447689 RepID=A0A1B9XY98_9FLAO|nr:hypothetical protein [Tenacibaculum soleae]OCK42530.1 hypothetical protein BA195_10160 [Tenacibaculum soleae]
MIPETQKAFADALPYLLTFVTGVGVWFKDKIATKLGIKKKENDVDNSSLNNVQKNLDIYQEMVEDLSEKYKQRIKDIEDSFDASMLRLQADLRALQALNEKFSKIIEEQKEIIRKQAKSLKYFQDKYESE